MRARGRPLRPTAVPPALAPLPPRTGRGPVAFLRAQWGGLPRAFWVLWVGTLVNRLGSFVVPFLSLYLTRSRGLDVGQAGLIVSLYGLGLIGAGPLGGYIADRFGRRAALLLGLCAGGSCAIALGSVQDIRAIAAFTLLFALLGETYRPAVQAAVADLVAPADRARAYGLLYWVINLGFTVAVVGAGLVVDRGFELLFYIDGATSLAYAVLVLVAVPETRPAAAGVGGQGVLRGLLEPLGDRVLLAQLAVSFLLVTIFWQHQVALPVDITAHGVSPAGYGRLIGLNGALIVLLQPWLTARLAPLDRARVLAVACLLFGLGFGANALATSAPLFALAIVIWSIGEIVHFPTASALVADLAPPALRGRYQGLLGMTGGLAAIAAPVAGGYLLQHVGRVALWGSCLLLGVVAALLQLAQGHRLRARLAALRTPPGDAETS